MVPPCVLVHPRHYVPHGTCNMEGYGCKIDKVEKGDKWPKGGNFFAAVLIY